METGTWLPLLEYAVRKGISISTLRRRIKANQIQYQLRNGRYFIFDHENRPNEDSQERVAALEEEIADLKTLVNVLESQAAL